MAKFRVLARQALAIALGLATTGVAPAAAAAEAAAPAAGAAPVAQDMQVLDEIMVRGKRLVDIIHDAEDEYFDLYNDLNKNDDYDMGCAMLNIDPDNPGSRLLTRVCMPGFVANSMADWHVYKMRCDPEFQRFDANRDGRVSWNEADGLYELQELIGMGNYISEVDFRQWALGYSMRANCYLPPPPELVLMEGTEDWRRHMTEVTNSDARLKKMADELGGLYYELWDLQRQAITADEERRKAKGLSIPGRNPKTN